MRKRATWLFLSCVMVGAAVWPVAAIAGEGDPNPGEELVPVPEATHWVCVNQWPVGRVCLPPW